ncbi:hypothetical protein ONS95_002492 [Cadophora gregata]|nr:uncharacterized protein ONS95_002492 [Cadophora gregata]KAK0109821.1 hypothetical protein ONS95_002492 [Cadophora gregata]KAK0110554.1 hypothetical protein ONS96_002159 [Cadophora gregata f. sp. sojae]
MDSNRPVFNTPFTNSIHQSPANSSWSSLTPTQSTPRSAAGRKRSRDEASSNLEEDYFQVPVPVIPEPENEDEWEYGEGMVLIKKGTGYVTDSTSQTGTWQEEKAAEEQAKLAAQIAAAAERPVIRATKSQRLNLSATPAIPEEVSQEAASPGGSPERHTEPTVDMFTLHLGIGWSSMDNAGPDIQAAARGWAKFIENHFPVTNAKIQLQSKGLSSYLVEANEGYFLFGEDLKQGRLVSTSLERLWVNLRGPAPVFDGDLVMEAGQTPKIDAQLLVEGAMNGIPVVGVANGINPPFGGEQTINGMTDVVDSPITNGGVSSNGIVGNGVQVMNGIASANDIGNLNGVHKPPQSIEVEMDMS